MIIQNVLVSTTATQPVGHQLKEKLGPTEIAGCVDDTESEQRQSVEYGEWGIIACHSGQSQLDVFPDKDAPRRVGNSFRTDQPVSSHCQGELQPTETHTQGSEGQLRGDRGSNRTGDKASEGDPID